MIEHSANITHIAAALLKFQGAVDSVEKNKVNPGFKSRYATLEAVRDTAGPELQNVGIAFLQSPGAIVDGVMALTTMLIHAESGEWLKLTGDIVLGKRDPQGCGSAITYMQRYSLMAALGLPPVDDDAEGAMQKSKQAGTAASEPKQEPGAKKDSRDLYATLVSDMRKCKTKEDVRRWIADADVKNLRAKLPADWDVKLRQEAAEHGNSLEAAPPSRPSFVDQFVSGAPL